MTRFRFVALLSVLVLTVTVSSWAAVFVSVAIGPPALPVYSQPLCPGPGYIWTPGYWAWGPDGYYWVPGTWVYPPEVGFLWTPGYWAFSTSAYYWHPGYWGPTVGFYGGIDYGYGYTGAGYYGGYWRGRNFYYNRAVNNVNVNNVHNVYNRTVVNNVNVTRVSYNGGPHGIQARPTSNQLAAERGRHQEATAVQVQHQQAARNDREQWASVNHGRPAIAATPRPGAFNSRETTHVNQPPANNRPENANAANHAVPRPPEKQQNHQSARNTENVPRPQQDNRAQQRTAENTPKPPTHQQQAAENTQKLQNHQQQARQANNPPRQAQPQYHAASHPPNQHQEQAPHQAAAHPPKSSDGHPENRPH
jgi:WXXGXW repeat (2 copies)